MRLRQYLDQRGLKINFVAASLGMDRNVLTRVDQGIAISQEFGERILKWSHGEIDVKMIEGSKGHVRYRGKKVSTSNQNS